MPELWKVVSDVRNALDLPSGYNVWGDEATGSVIVGTDRLAFCLTPKMIEDGEHIKAAQESLPSLKMAIAQCEEHQDAKA